ncbi:MAG: hypothetical protein JWN35_2192 [Frankiales bacterium]|jgi:hypothetical protein|nr:hypothetical protein [Frankiales bacterium]
MYAFVVFLGLALGLTVVMQVIDELVPLKVPAALTRTLAVAFAAGFAWALDYSVFTPFGQDLRAAWMHPVATGLVLVGGGEFVRSVVHVLGHRAGEPPVEVAPVSRVRAA